MLIVTGGIACGKSTFLEVARKMGLNCIDADDWFHDYFKPYMPKNLIKTLYGDAPQEPFVHPKWDEYISFIDYSFWNWLNYNQDSYEIVAIPDLFKRPIANGLKGIKVLTIERPYNLKAAVERDSHRSRDLTVKIHQYQMDPGTRRNLADYVLENDGTKEEFEKECEEWLKLHSLDRLTRRM